MKTLQRFYGLSTNNEDTEREVNRRDTEKPQRQMPVTAFSFSFFFFFARSETCYRSIRATAGWLLNKIISGRS